MWCIPPKANAAFVCAMEDVLEVYARPLDPKRPLVCMDEAVKQLLAEPRPPLPAQPRQVLRYDYHYERQGVAHLFLFVAPLLGQRWVQVRKQHTAIAWALAMRDLAQHFPDAERIVVVLDNLNTHRAASFYKAFPAPQARQLAQRFEFHYTPVHGSWLNMAEIELSILSRQCLRGRIPSTTVVEAQVNAWEKDRNAYCSRIDWHFTTQDARTKLKRLYPVFSS